ncbi:DNA polymerase/3'-5' exonuclease PolX [Candidatus Woesearchaeota archaeon]|nr:DNA polymerase/3'-5' exonuclease PolX [Candidatus Woesearchaeota archaeon]
MKNLEIAQLLYHIADMLELQEVPFKPQAYRNAARSIETLAEDIKAVAEKGELNKIHGVGEHIAEKIKEILDTGKLLYYEKLKKEVGMDLEQLLRIPSLGPKRVKLLNKELGIKDVAGLEKAIKSGKLRTIRGFGEELEQTLLRGIELLKSHPHRFPYAQALPIVNEILSIFKKSETVQQIEIAGSFRRGKETVGDLDFLAVSKTPEKVMQLFTSLPDVKEVLAKGATKSAVRLGNGLQMDLRVVKEKEFGSALLYFIGNKEHNIELRKLALSKGYTLSEYGLFKLKGKKKIKDKNWVAGRTEEEVYKKLGMEHIPPEIRGNRGEIEAALKHQLPKLITNSDLKGLFHNHSTWSDGDNSLLEMAQRAEEMGFKFISFNDHYSRLGLLDPLTEKRLSGYLKEIEKVRKKVGIRVFSGIEIDIQKDGSLLLARNKLKELDIVLASMHTSLEMPEPEMTKRVCSALENYPINIFGHPTCIRFGERESIALNLEKVFETAKRNKVFMEINTAPNRMDLNGTKVHAALRAGCKVAIGTDAHRLSGLETYPLGILCARRGWAEKKDVVNCWELKKVEKELER